MSRRLALAALLPLSLCGVASAALPTDAWQHVTSFQFAPEGVGLDYDGDGRPDNAIYDALDLMVDVATDAFADTVALYTDHPGVEDPCESTEAGCPLIPVQEAAAVTAFHARAEDVFNVARLNEGLAASVADDSAAWAIHLERGVGITYERGALGEGGIYHPERPFGEQPGAWTLRGSSEFGPGSLTVDIPVRDPTSGLEGSLTFDLLDALTGLDYGHDATRGALTGGGIDVYQIVPLVNAVLHTMEAAGLLPEDFDVHAVVEAVADAVYERADILCPSTGRPCVSATWIYDAEQVRAR